jgi:hypothetical protein
MGQTPQTIANRLGVLERRVENLERLPDRVTALELQISQLRVEMRDEFSALRTEMHAGDEETRQQLREEMQGIEERLRGEMRELNAETRTHMLVLHEEVISRIALLGEQFNGRHGSTRATGTTTTRGKRRSRKG